MAPGRAAEPPAPAMMTSMPRSWAESTAVSWGMPNSFRVSRQPCMRAASDREPMTTATRGWSPMVYGHQQGRVWLRAELSRIFAFEVQAHCLLQVRDGLVKRLALGDHVDAHALGNVVRVAL